MSKLRIKTKAIDVGSISAPLGNNIDELYYEADKSDIATPLETTVGDVPVAPTKAPNFNEYKFEGSQLTPAHAQSRLYFLMLRDLGAMQAQRKMDGHPIQYNQMLPKVGEPQEDIVISGAEALRLQQQVADSTGNKALQPTVNDKQVADLFGDQWLRISSKEIRQFLDSGKVLLPPEFPPAFYIKLVDATRNIPRLTLQANERRSILEMVSQNKNDPAFEALATLLAEAITDPYCTTKYGFQDIDAARALLEGKSYAELGTMPAQVMQGKFFLGADGKIDAEAPALFMINHAGLTWNDAVQKKYLHPYNNNELPERQATPFAGDIKAEEKQHLVDAIKRDMITEFQAGRMVGAQIGSFMGSGLGVFLKTVPKEATRKEIIEMYANTLFDILKDPTLGYEDVYFSLPHVARQQPLAKDVFADVFNRRLAAGETLGCNFCLHSRNALTLAAEKQKEHPQKIVVFNNPGDARNTLSLKMGENADVATPNDGYAADEHLAANSTEALFGLSDNPTDLTCIYTLDTTSDQLYVQASTHMPKDFEPVMPREYQVLEKQEKCHRAILAIKLHIENRDWGTARGVARFFGSKSAYPDVARKQMDIIKSFEENTNHDPITTLQRIIDAAKPTGKEPASSYQNLFAQNPGMNPYRTVSVEHCIADTFLAQEKAAIAPTFDDQSRTMKYRENLDNYRAAMELQKSQVWTHLPPSGNLRADAYRQQRGDSPDYESSSSSSSSKKHTHMLGASRLPSQPPTNPMQTAVAKSSSSADTADSPTLPKSSTH